MASGRNLRALVLVHRWQLPLGARYVGPIGALQHDIDSVSVLDLVTRNENADRNDQALVDGRNRGCKHGVESRAVDVQLPVGALRHAVREKGKIEVHATILRRWGRSCRSLG